MKQTPSPDDLRHPKAGVIDQRQQRIDPANKVTADPNDQADTSTKQPGNPTATKVHPDRQR